MASGVGLNRLGLASTIPLCFLVGRRSWVWGVRALLPEEGGGDGDDFTVSILRFLDLDLVAVGGGAAVFLEDDVRFFVWDGGGDAVLFFFLGFFLVTGRI